MSIQTIPNELLYRVLKTAVREEILDIPDIKAFRQCSRDCAAIGKSDKIWLQIALRIDEDFKSILIKRKLSDRTRPSIFEVFRKYLSDYTYMKRGSHFLCSDDKKFYLPNTIKEVKDLREEQTLELEAMTQVYKVLCKN